jgi:hypothetical protein
MRRLLLPCLDMDPEDENIRHSKLNEGSLALVVPNDSAHRPCPTAARSRHPFRMPESTLGIGTLPQQTGVYVPRRLNQANGPVEAFGDLGRPLPGAGQVGFNPRPKPVRLFEKDTRLGMVGALHLNLTGRAVLLPDDPLPLLAMWPRPRYCWLPSPPPLPQAATSDAGVRARARGDACGISSAERSTRGR